MCDLAETYHLYTIEGLSCSYVAALVCGLRDDSRIKMRMSGMKVPVDTYLLASIVDQLAFISWTKTEDAEKNRNRPKSIVKALLGEEEKPKKDRKVFNSFEEFQKEWNKEG